MKTNYKRKISYFLFYIFIICFTITTVFDFKYYFLIQISILIIIFVLNIINNKATYLKAESEGIKIKYEGINENYEIYIINQRLMGNHNVSSVFLDKPVIFIEDAVSKSLNNKEIYSILQHEIGHLISRDGIKSLILKYISVACAAFGWHMSIYEQINYSLPCMLVGVGSVMFYSYYIKRNEFLADEYSIRNGVEKDILIQALSKINQLNLNESRYKKNQLSFKTHPNLEKRFSRIKNLHV